MNGDEDWGADFEPEKPKVTFSKLRIDQQDTKQADKVALVGLQASLEKEDYDNEFASIEHINSTQPQTVNLPQEEDWDVEILGDQAAELRVQVSKNLQRELAAENAITPSLTLHPTVSNFHHAQRLKPGSYNNVLKYPKSTQLWSNQSATDSLKQLPVPETQLCSYILALTESAHTSLKSQSKEQDWTRPFFIRFVKYYRTSRQAESEAIALSMLEAYDKLKLSNPQQASIQDIGEVVFRFVSYLSKIKVYGSLSLVQSPAFQKLYEDDKWLQTQCRLLSIESSIHHIKNIIVNEHELCQLYDHVHKLSLSQSQLTTAKLGILIDLQCINFGIDPLSSTTMNVEDLEDDDSDTYSIIHDQKRIAVDSDFRFKEILHYYSLAESSYVKAKAAYVMSLYELHELNNAANAESLVFECLWLLRQLDPQNINPSPPVQSSLGYNALKLYGEVLLVNKKSMYAVCAFEAALQNLRYRQKPVTIGQLSNLAQICVNGNVYSKAVQHYQEAIELCKPENKINEYVHLVNTLSDIMITHGHGFEATSVCKDACQYLETQVLNTADSSQLTLLLTKMTHRLASLNYQLRQFDECLFTLEKFIIQQAHQIQGLIDCVLLLGKCYYKKSWFKECLDLLSCSTFLKNDATVLGVTLVQDTPKDSSIGFLLAQQVKKIPDSESLQSQLKNLFVKLCAKAFYQMRFPQESLSVLKNYDRCLDYPVLHSNILAMMAHMKLQLQPKVDFSDSTLKKASFSSSHLLITSRFQTRKSSSTLPAKISETSQLQVGNNHQPSVTVKDALDVLDKTAEVKFQAVKIKRAKITLLVQSLISRGALIEKVPVLEVLKGLNISFSLELVKEYAISCLDNSFSRLDLHGIALDYANLVDVLFLLDDLELAKCYHRECWTFIRDYLCVTIKSNLKALRNIVPRLVRCHLLCENILISDSDRELLGMMIYVDAVCRTSQFELQRQFQIYRNELTKGFKKKSYDGQSNVTSKSSNYGSSGSRKPIQTVERYPSVSEIFVDSQQPSGSTLDTSSSHHTEDSEEKSEERSVAISDNMQDHLTQSAAATSFVDADYQNNNVQQFAALSRLIQSNQFGNAIQIQKNFQVEAIRLHCATNQIQCLLPDKDLTYILEFGDHWCFVALSIGLVKFYRLNESDVFAAADKPAVALSEALTPQKGLKQSELVKFKLFVSDSGSLDSHCVIEAPSYFTLDDVASKLTQKKLVFQASFETASSTISSKTSGTTSSSSSGKSNTSSAVYSKKQMEKNAADLTAITVKESSSKATMFLNQAKDSLVDTGQFVFATKNEHSTGKASFYKLPWSANLPLGDIPILSKKGSVQPAIYYISSRYVVSPSYEIQEQRRSDTIELLQHFIRNQKVTAAEPSSSKMNQIVKELRMSAFPRLEPALSQLLSKDGTFLVATSANCAIYPWELIITGRSIVRCYPSVLQDAQISQQSSGAGNTAQRVQLYCFFNSTEGSEARQIERNVYNVNQVAVDISNGRLKSMLTSSQCYDVYPHRSSLLKYGKKVAAYKQRYGLINFIDASKFNSIVQAINFSVPYSLFLLSYADLQEMNQWTIQILSLKINATVLFIPSLSSKVVIGKIHEFVEAKIQHQKSTANDAIKPGSFKLARQMSANDFQSTMLFTNEDSIELDWKSELFTFIKGLEKQLEVPLPVFWCHKPSV